MDINKIYVYIFVLISASQTTNGQSRFTTPSSLSPHWGGWSSWSSCTTKKEVGTRIRNRLCIGRSCHRLPGEKYELQLCSQTDMRVRSQKTSFINKCKFDPKMNNTLSCKLYLEKPVMAYNIFKTANCLFDLVENQDDEGEGGSFYQSLLRRISTAHLQEFQNDKEQLFSSRLTRVIRANRANSTRGNKAFLRREERKHISRFCKNTCGRLVLQSSAATGDIASASSSTNSHIHLSRGNAIHDGNSIAVSLEYASCLKICRSSGADYRVLAKKILNRSLDLSQHNLKLCMNLEDKLPEVLNRKRRGTSSSATAELVRSPIVLTRKESEMYVKDVLYSRRPGISRKVVKDDKRRFDKILSSNPTPEQLQHIMAILQEETARKSHFRNRQDLITTVSQTTIRNEEENITLTRTKRQIVNASRYQSPCYETVDYPDNPRVLNLDNTIGELFFFEGMQQRFLRRRCAGSVVVPGTLFRPRESVIQTQTGRLALCKQGFLKRYGLIIQQDPAGLFAFNDGVRFSLKFRPFKLESHCALSTFA